MFHHLQNLTETHHCPVERHLNMLQKKILGTENITGPQNSNRTEEKPHARNPIQHHSFNSSGSRTYQGENGQPNINRLHQLRHGKVPIPDGPIKRRSPTVAQDSTGGARGGYHYNGRDKRNMTLQGSHLTDPRRQQAKKTDKNSVTQIKNIMSPKHLWKNKKQVGGVSRTRPASRWRCWR